MRDRFVGDVGDIGKYGLLRALCGKDLGLGVVWYFVRDRMVDYLNEPDRFEACDQELFGVLKNIVNGCQRKTTSIAVSDLFPEGTVFFEDDVPPKLDKRNAWVKKALKDTGACEAVFFDPDNGVKDGDLPKRGLSAKYVYSVELEPFASRGQSLIIYHSLNMTQSHGWQIDEVARSLSKRLDGVRVWALRWRPFLPRAYFIIPNGREAVLRPRIKAMLKGPWGQDRPEGPHFEPVLFP